MVQRSSEYLRFAGDVNIEKVNITTSSGFTQEITNQVIGLQIFEDLFSPFITGSLIVKDSLDLLNLFPFSGEEFLQLKVSTPTFKDAKIDGNFYIFKMADREIIGDRSVVYELHFITQEAVIDLNKRISKSYSGKCSEIAKTLMEDKEFGLQLKRKIYIEETKNSTKFISNYWNPVKCLNYLCDHSLNTNDSPTFVFYENRAGFNFVSLETLYTNNDVVQEFVYDNYKRDDLSGGQTVVNPEEQYKRIKELRIPTVYDYMKNTQEGMYASKQYTFDITTKTVFINNYDIKTDFEKQKHLNPHAPISANAVYRSNAMIITKPSYYGSFTDQKDVTNASFLQKRISSMRQADANKIEITVPGRTDYTVGQKVIINIDKMQPMKKAETNTRDEIISGAYIIGAINHYIDRERHECVMELFKESMLKNMNGKSK
jgi:hypothetical protein